MFKLGILRWEGDLGLSRWFNIFTRSLRGGRRVRVSKGRHGDGTRSQRERFGNRMLLALKMEEGTMSLGMPGDLQTLEMARKQIFPTVSGENSPANTLIIGLLVSQAIK